MRGVGLVKPFIFPPLPRCEEDVRPERLGQQRGLWWDRSTGKHSSEKTSIAMWLWTNPPTQRHQILQSTHKTRGSKDALCL